MMMSLFFLLAASITQEFEDLADKPQIVIEKKMIRLEDFPESYNPSVVKVDDGYLLSFRYCPDRYSNPWQNYIGVVLLDDSFEPISSGQILSSRSKSSRTQSQAEDARMFTYRGRVFVTYNDNAEVNYPSYSDRRDIYIAEIIRTNNQFSLSAPIKLFYENKRHILWQKNWVPFEWDKKLLVGYSVNPHEILYANLQNGVCYPCYETVFSHDWLFGTLRGSTTPILVDGEYLAFFHSGIVTSSYASWGWDMWHYFMGAYTFSAKPPFEITKISPLPIVSEDFYTQSSHEKRVIFPGGLVDAGPHLYLVYGKDDCEIWVAKIDKKALFDSLKLIQRP